MLLGCDDTAVGIESKRYEPYRVRGVERMRHRLTDGSMTFEQLDAAQLVKHAFGLRTAGSRSGRASTLVYLHREPQSWPEGRAIPDVDHARHRAEVASLAELVADDEVAFVHLTWFESLTSWAGCKSDEVRRHAAAVAGIYGA